MLNKRKINPSNYFILIIDYHLVGREMILIAAKRVTLIAP